MKKGLLFLIILTSFRLLAQNTSDTVEIQPFPISNLTSAAEETDVAVKRIRDKINSPENSAQVLLNEFEIIKNGAEAMRLDTAQEALEQYNLWALTDLLNKWIRYEKQVDDIKKSMNNLSVKYQDAYNTSDHYYQRWEKTKLSSSDADLPESLTDRIALVMGELKTTSQNIKDSLTVVLEKFDVVSKEFNLILEIEQNIKNLSDSKKLNVFSKDALPYFKSIKTNEDSTNIVNQISSVWSNTKQDTRDFLRENKTTAESHLAFIILLTILFFYIKHSYNKSHTEEDVELKTAHYLINNPLAVSLVLNLLISFWVYTNAPTFVGQMFLFLLLIPIIFLLPGLLEKKFRIAIYAIAILYTFNQLGEFMPTYPNTQRTLILIQSVLAAIALAYGLRPKAPIYKIKTPFSRNLIRIAFLFLFFSLLAIYGNLSGSLFLARLLSRSIIISSAVAVALSLGYIILDSLITFLFSSKTGKLSNLIRLQGDIIKNKLLFYLKLAAIFVWVKSLLNSLGLYSFIIDSFESLMNVGWNFGNLYLSLGEVVNFIIIIFVFSILANILRGLLEVEILPRLNLQKGVPMAAGLITRYFVLVLGFLMAVAAAGISLDKLGFMVGALSVGIGFGLQNVVGNFVSGLILIFERPVRIGDIVSASNVEGTITEIGIRASKIKDWDGAEIIVPNSELISLKVTNFTLSDSKRRREVIVRVEYGTDPHQIIDLLKYVMSQHPGVIKEPSPNVIFLGYKEYSLDFRVLFWVTENPLSTTSEITLGIHDELKKAGIKIPIPKQEWIEDKKNVKKSAPKKKEDTTKKGENPPQKTS